MKAFTRGFALLMLLAFTQAGISYAQASDLSGKWKITWMENGKAVGTANTINLTEINGAGKTTTLSGNFIADDGEKCSVSGHRSSDTERQLDMSVSCATWSISMNGAVAADGQQINGSYTVHYPSGPHHGDYVMDKVICMLPEGCGN